MDRILRMVFLQALSVCLCAQQPTLPTAKSLADLLTFEAPNTVGGPGGWGGGPLGTLFADSDIVHSGHGSGRIHRDAGRTDEFSTFTKSIVITFGGSVVELRGFMRLQDVDGYAAFWMREDGEGRSLAFESMQKQQLKGTADWKEYSIKLPVHHDARLLSFGFLLGGTGTVWADDLQLLVDSKPVWEAPAVQRPTTVLDTDRQFDRGSGIALQALSPVQVENLVTLGKVWGFVKYHHPAIASGKVHWDYDLFRTLPRILEAADRNAANAAMVEWLAKYPVEDCTTCATLKEAGLHLRPDVAWIHDEASLGAKLSAALQAIYKNRWTGEKQFYISTVPNIGNPSFDHEPTYTGIQMPDPGLQLLAVYRFWNIVQYWFPYRDVMGENWDVVLAEFIQRVALAKDATAYQLELMALVARVHDTHANLWSSLNLRPPAGDCAVPVTIRYIENRFVVAATPPPDSTLQRADAITALDGTAVETLVANWSP